MPRHPADGANAYLCTKIEFHGLRTQAVFTARSSATFCSRMATLTRCVLDSLRYAWKNHQHHHHSILHAYWNFEAPRVLQSRFIETCFVSIERACFAQVDNFALFYIRAAIAMYISDQCNPFTVSVARWLFSLAHDLFPSCLFHETDNLSVSWNRNRKWMRYLYLFVSRRVWRSC